MCPDINELYLLNGDSKANFSIASFSVEDCKLGADVCGSWEEVQERISHVEVSTQVVTRYFNADKLKEYG